MSLIGTVDTLALSELFGVLADAGKTGALHVRSEQGLGIVWFERGKLCAGEAGHRCGPVEGREALVARLHDVCFELFRFEESSFEFDPGERPTWPATEVLEVADVLAETARRLARWAEIRVAVPSLDARPRLVPDRAGDGVILDPDQWRLVAAIDGRRRISALIRVLDSSDFEICGQLASLVEIGLVALDAADPAGLRTEVEDPAEPPPDRRWAPPRPSRLAAVLDEDHWGSGHGGPDELDMWDEQILAATGGPVPQPARETVREATRKVPSPTLAELDDAEPEVVAEAVSEDEEPEVLTSP